MSGDVLVAALGEPLGRSCVVPQSLGLAIVKADCFRIRPWDEIDPRFLSCWLNAPQSREQFAGNSHGLGRVRINLGDLREHTLPLPPLAEQRRIVAKLDQLMARTARARAELARIPALIAHHKRAILAATFRGDLSADSRAQRTKADGLPIGWKWETVEALAADVPRAIQSGPFGSNLLHSEFQSSGRLVVGIDNVQDGFFSPGSQNRISEEKFAELEKYSARPRDVVITVMATVGRTCVIPDDIEPAIITKHVYRITPDQERVDPQYLMNALRGSETMLEEMGANIRGQTRAGINGTILKALRVPLAPLRDQREIVRRIGSAFAWLNKVAHEHAQATRLLDHLDQKLLAKAFRGELVGQDPADEPAAALLARIRANRETAAPAARKRKAQA